MNGGRPRIVIQGSIGRYVRIRGTTVAALQSRKNGRKRQPGDWRGEDSRRSILDDNTRSPVDNLMDLRRRQGLALIEAFRRRISPNGMVPLQPSHTFPPERLFLRRFSDQPISTSVPRQKPSSRIVFTVYAQIRRSWDPQHYAVRIYAWSRHRTLLFQVRGMQILNVVARHVGRRRLTSSLFPKSSTRRWTSRYGRLASHRFPLPNIGVKDKQSCIFPRSRNLPSLNRSLWYSRKYRG